MKAMQKLMLVLAGISMGALPSMATTPDASGIVTTATTTFETVGTLVVATVGFFIIVKIVKWVRK